MVSDRVEIMQDETTASPSRKSISVKGESHNENNSMPLLTRRAFRVGPVRSRGIWSASFGTF
jgi:hypothetical protein